MYGRSRRIGFDRPAGFLFAGDDYLTRIFYSANLHKVVGSLPKTAPGVRPLQIPQNYKYTMPGPF
jgi:hypothetical protein